MDLEHVVRELERLSRESAENRLRQGELDESLRQELKTLGRQLSRLEERQRSLEERHDGLMHMLLDTQTQLGDQVEQALGRVRHLEKSWQNEESFRTHVEQSFDRLENELDEQRAGTRSLEEWLEQRHAEWQDQAEANRIDMEAQLADKWTQLEGEWIIRHRELDSLLQEERSRQEALERRIEGLDEQNERTTQLLATLEQERLEALVRRLGRFENDLIALTEHGAIQTETLGTFQQRTEQLLTERESHLARRLDETVTPLHQILGHLEQTQRDHRQELARTIEEGVTQQRALDAVREAGEARDSNLYRELERLREELELAQKAWEREVPVLQGRMKEVVQLLIKAGRLERAAPGTQASAPAQAPPQPAPGIRKAPRRNP